MKFKFSWWAVLILLLGISAVAIWGQSGPVLAVEDSGARVNLTMPGGAAAVRLTPELAWRAFEERQREENSLLAGYSDDTLMIASLPDTQQNGEYELKRSYAAPNSLRYTPVRFSGDNFVKSNVLLRLLHAEVDHTVKEEGPLTAINDENYKFTVKSLEWRGDRPVYVFQVKPRAKRVGLFKGKVYLDASSGVLLRAEGTMVKSPSFFIRKLEFVQDYAQIGGFTLPTHLRSVAKVRIIGHTIVDVFHRDYQPLRVASIHAASGALGNAK